MSGQSRRRFVCLSAAAVLAILAVAAVCLAARVAAPRQMAMRQTAPVKVTRLTVETVEVEKEVVVTQVVEVVETVEVEQPVVATEAMPPAAPTNTPEAGPTEASPPTPSSPGAVVQKELERLAAGRIVHNPPAEMTVDKTERVEVRISMDMAAPITTGLKGSGSPTVESIPVSCFMKVRLVGEAFAVVALSSEEQIVPTEGLTEWPGTSRQNKQAREPCP